MRRSRILLLLLSGLVGGGCWRTPAPKQEFDLVRTSPSLAADAPPLLLNDSVTAYFSAPVHALSVTSDTFSVVDEAGNQVPGNLRVGASWVTFEPRPPMANDLGDGSFRAGRTYRLLIAGHPRPDAVRAGDGRRLQKGCCFELRMAPATTPPAQLLRPLDPGLPFLLRPYDSLQSLAADAPRLRLHFTVPVQPVSVTADAFRIQRLGGPVDRIVPRSVRVVASGLDEFPGSSIEIDLGSQPRSANGDSLRPLHPGDCISVGVHDVASPLRDFAGNPVLAMADQCWSVVAGTRIALYSWPVADGGIVDDDPVMPGFESASGLVRPRARLEAGDGSLGVFRPTRDTVLRPDQPFDRGDGVLVASRGSAFPFLAVEIPTGVTVRVEQHGGEPLAVLSCGGIRIAGTLVLVAPTVPLQVPRPGSAVRDLLDSAPIALLAAGDVAIAGRIATELPVAAGRTVMTVASAGRIRLNTELPVNTVIAVESTDGTPSAPAIEGPRGQVVATVASFTSGAPTGARWQARGCSPWRSAPSEVQTATVELLDAEEGVTVGWQVAPADPVRRTVPDLTVGRVGRAEPVVDQSRINLVSGGFGRFVIAAEVVGGRPLPSLRELRLLDH